MLRPTSALLSLALTGLIWSQALGQEIQRRWRPDVRPGVAVAKAVSGLIVPSAGPPGV